MNLYDKQKENAMKPLTHPLDDLFDIEQSGNDLIPVMPDQSALSIPEGQPQQPEKDAEDLETDAKIDTVYTSALETFKRQIEYTDIIEPRYAARNAEVAASYLNIALQAAATKAKVKMDRKRTNAFVPGMGQKITNNTIVATRDEIMRMIDIDNNKKDLK